MATHTFDFGQYRVKAIERSFADGSGQRSYWSKSKVYGAINALVPELNAELDRWTETPVTVQFKEDNPAEAERIMRGYNSAKRRTTKEAKMKLEALLGAMSDVFGVAPQVQTFSVKAGCSCSCSPGFILTSRLSYENHGVDLWIERVEQD